MKLTKLLLLSAAILTSVPVAQAELVGIETFSYPDGTIIGQTGGFYWDWTQNTDSPKHSGTVSDWDSVPSVGDATISGNTLITRRSGAEREFNGPGEGFPDTSDEGDGAFRGSDSVFFSTTMTREAGATWSGISSSDFGTERLYFGVPIRLNNGRREFGIVVDGIYTFSGMEAVDGETYTLVAKIDYGNELLSLWVNPLNAIEELSTPDLTVPYFGTHWCTAIRVYSGGTGDTRWNNLVVSTTFEEALMDLRNQGETVGIETFSYPDGSIVDRTGGTYWDWSQNTDSPSHTGTSSDWDSIPGASTATINNGSLITQNSGAEREFNGTDEGLPDTSDEGDGAFNGSDSVYFSINMTRESGATWSGIFSSDFGAERVFFGVPSRLNGGRREFGIEFEGNYTYSGIQPVDGENYTLVAKIDYAADLLSLWVNPTNITEEASPPDVTAPYPTGFWCTAVRIQSGGGGNTNWDNLVVANSFEKALTPIIENPSFEGNSISTWPGYGSIMGWTGTDSIGINPVIGGDTPFADNGAIPDGSQVGFIQRQNSASTTITRLRPGTYYSVSIRTNQRNGGPAAYGPPIAFWSVIGNPPQSLVASPSVDQLNVFTSPYYTNNSLLFLATDDTAVLEISNSSTPDTALLIDDLRITPIAFGARTYARWVAANVLPGQDTNFYADADNNGTPNGLEFALGSPSIRIFQSEEGDPQGTRRILAPQIFPAGELISLQRSTDLRNWNSIVTWNTPVSGGTTVITDASVRSVSIGVVHDVGGQNPVFYRYHIQ